MRRQLTLPACMIAAALLLPACHGRRGPAPLAGDGGVELVAGRQVPCTDLAPCEAACDAGDGPACMFAGRFHEFARGVERNVPKALARYERSCELGYAAGCYNVAVLLERGDGGAGDRARATALYRKVCAAGSSTACEAASRLQGPPADGGPT